MVSTCQITNILTLTAINASTFKQVFCVLLAKNGYYKNVQIVILSEPLKTVFLRP